MLDDSSNDLIAQRRIGRRDVAGEERCFGFEQPGVILKVDTRFGTEALHALQKAKIALVSATRRACALNPAQFIKIMQFLYRRHPEIRMRVELLIKPCRSSFLSAHTQEIRTRIAGRRVIVFPIAVVTCARFEWPGPTHVALFSSLPLKSKPGRKVRLDDECWTFPQPMKLLWSIRKCSQPLDLMFGLLYRAANARE